MALKKFFCFAALAALIASPATAQTLSVQLQENGSGNPMLDANGDWVWEVYLNTDADGGAADVSFGVQFSDADLISGSVPTTGSGLGGVEQETAGDMIFSWLPAEGGEGNAFPVGLEVDASQGTNGEAFYSFGTGILTASEVLLLGTFTTDGPSTTGSLTTTIDIVMGSVGQNDTSGGLTTGLTANGSYTAYPGDANLDGSVNSSDLAILAGNFNTSGKNWATADFTGDGAVNSSDLAILAGTFNTSAPAPVAATTTPEPGSVVLLGLLVSAGVCRRQNR